MIASSGASLRCLFLSLVSGIASNLSLDCLLPWIHHLEYDTHYLAIPPYAWYIVRAREGGKRKRGSEGSGGQVMREYLGGIVFRCEWLFG